MTERRRLRTYGTFFVVVAAIWLLLRVTVFGEEFGVKAVLIALAFGVLATGIAAWQTERRPARGQSPRES